jgi:hypothetical protein
MLKVEEKVQHQVHFLVHKLNKLGLIFKFILFFLIALINLHLVLSLFLWQDFTFIRVLSDEVPEYL